MFKFRIDAKDDYKGPEAYAGRRKFEEERKQRIFNAKRRIMGIDVQTLDKQIVEKQKINYAKKEIEKNWVESQIREGKAVKSMQLALEQEKRSREMDLNNYRKTYQKKADRCCDVKREKSPARRFDYDPVLGISSAQIFSGDDVDVVERRAKQRQQQRNYFEQQIKQKKQDEFDKKKAEESIDRALNTRERKLDEISKTEEENQKQIRLSIIRYNQNMAAQKKAQQEEARKRTSEDNLAEIYNMLGSDMLCESQDVAQSRLSANRKVAYMYRGSTPEEKFKYQVQLQEQVQQKKDRDYKETMSNKEWERIDNKRGLEMLSKVHEFEKVRRDMFDDDQKINLLLGREQNIRKEFMKNDRNEITDDFYNQFNKSTR